MIKHRVDMAQAGIGSDPRAPVRTLLPPVPSTLLVTLGAASPGAQLAGPNLAGTFPFRTQAPLVNSAGLGWAGTGDQLSQQPGSGASPAGALQPIIGGGQA